MSNSILGGGVLRNVDVSGAVDMLARFFGALGESMSTLDELSVPEQFDALIRLGVGINSDISVNCLARDEVGRFDVAVQFNAGVDATDFDAVVGVVGVFVHDRCELRFVGTDTVPWRYVVDEGAVRKQQGHVVFDGPDEPVGVSGNEGSASRILW